jgi:hypothetical protein
MIALEWNIGTTRTGVRSGQSEPVGEHPAGEGDLTVGAADRLRLAAGSGGEDEHQQIISSGINRIHWRATRLVDHFRPLRTSEIQDPHAEVQAFQQGRVLCLDEYQLAVRDPNVAGECPAAAGGIQADQHRTVERGSPEQKRERRHIVREDPDVWRLARREKFAHDGSVAGAGPDMLGPGPGRVFESQPRPGVVRPGQQQSGDRGEAVHAGSAASSSRSPRSWAVAPPRANSSRFAAAKYRCSG